MVEKLWGDWYFDNQTREFNDSEYATASKRGFVEFVLEPIYKIYSIVLGTDPKGFLLIKLIFHYLEYF